MAVTSPQRDQGTFGSPREKKMVVRIEEKRFWSIIQLVKDDGYFFSGVEIFKYPRHATQSLRAHFLFNWREFFLRDAFKFHQVYCSCR